MTCASCVARVEEALSSVHGVISANVNLASEKATVEYTEGTSIAGLSDREGEEEKATATPELLEVYLSQCRKRRQEQAGQG